MIRSGCTGCMTICARTAIAIIMEYRGVLVGDVSLRGDGELAIVICRDDQNRHIGRRCIREMLKLAREKGMARVTANLYSFNHQSKRMFRAVGFEKTGEAGDTLYALKGRKCPHERMLMRADFYASSRRGRRTL